jgi:hemoglobin
MTRPLALAAALLTIGTASAQTVEAPPPPAAPAEPIKGTPAENAGAAPFKGEGIWKAFHEQAGVHRIVGDTIDLSMADPRISDIFKGNDIPKLKKLLEEQFCYLLGGGCTYTGRDMKTAHKDMGLQMSDFNALVENLQTAMDKEHVPFRDQNRLLAKLAPMERATVTR